MLITLKMYGSLFMCLTKRLQKITFQITNVLDLCFLKEVQITFQNFLLFTLKNKPDVMRFVRKTEHSLALERHTSKDLMSMSPI